MNKRGFTLVELLATITILGIVLAIAIPNILESTREAALETKCEADKNAIIDAATTYLNDNIGIKNDIIKVSDLIYDEYLKDDYSKYKNIKIEINSNDSNGINKYDINLSNENLFLDICK